MNEKIINMRTKFDFIIQKNDSSRNSCEILEKKKKLLKLKKRKIKWKLGI